MTVTDNASNDIRPEADVAIVRFGYYLMLEP